LVTKDAKPVHVSLLEGDGGVYGVGMPIVAYVDRTITDASAFATATTVTVNGKPAGGAGYWQKSGRQGQALEAHYRPRTYWPAHAKIFVNLPVQGFRPVRAWSSMTVSRCQSAPVPRTCPLWTAARRSSPPLPTAS
jgi:hypothetical protein